MSMSVVFLAGEAVVGLNDCCVPCWRGRARTLVARMMLVLPRPRTERANCPRSSERPSRACLATGKPEPPLNTEQFLQSIRY